MLGMLYHVLTDRGSQAEADVCINVDFADAHAGSLAQHVFRHAAGTADIAAVLVAELHKFLGHGGGTMQDQGVVGQFLADGFQPGEVEVRLALELVGAVACADGNSQRVAACLFDKVHSLVGIGEGMLGILHMFLNAGQLAKLGLYPDTAGMGIFNDFLGDGDIFFVGQGGTVDHDGGKAAVDAVLAHLKGRAVVQMDADRDAGILDQGCFDQLHDVDLAGIFSGASRNLQNHGRLLFRGSTHNALNDFHIVDVKRTNGELAFIGSFKHFFGANKGHVKPPEKI